MEQKIQQILIPLYTFIFQKFLSENDKIAKVVGWRTFYKDSCGQRSKCQPQFWFDAFHDDYVRRYYKGKLQRWWYKKKEKWEILD